MSASEHETPCCWCCARWMLTRPATQPDGTCDTCHARTPSACDNAHYQEAQGAEPAEQDAMFGTEAT